MKKLKDMKPEFFEELTTEEMDFLQAWEELYEDEEFWSNFEHVVNPASKEEE